MTKILFVCHGNICRSPAAEFVFLSLAEKAGLQDQFEVASAATSSEEIGNPVYPPMRRVLEARGYSCGEKTARRIRRADYDYYDLIIGMDDENRWNLRRFYEGDPDGKLHDLMEYTPHPEEIPDPWYTRDFVGALEAIEYGCERLLTALTGVVLIDFSSCGEIAELYAELRDKMDWEPWYGNNLDALYDILTGLPHHGRSFVFTMPADDAPAEVRLVASRILETFAEAERDLADISEEYTIANPEENLSNSEEGCSADSTGCMSILSEDNPASDFESSTEEEIPE